MIHVIMMLYDVIMWHWLYDIWRVYDASSEWRRMMRTPRMNPYAACMYVVCMCLNDIVMNFFSVWCTRRMRRKSLHECCMKSYDVNMNVWRFREEMTEFREEMRSFPWGTWLSVEVVLNSCSSPRASCRRWCTPCASGHLRYAYHCCSNQERPWFHD